jgi:hypothetical protein
MNNSFIDRVNAIVQQNQSTDPAYPDAGIGALENVANNVPRQAQLMNQPHMLAYINPQEEQMLRDMGGAGLPGPDGIPVYGFFDWARDTASNIGSSIKETASNVYDTVSTAATNTFGDQGSVETFFDTYVADFDGDSTPTNTVYGTGPLEEVTSGPITYTDNNGVEHSTQAAADAANVVIDAKFNPLDYSMTEEGRAIPKEQLIAEARAAGLSHYVLNGNYEPVPDEVVETEDTGGALPTGSNSVRETLANLVTPFDGAKYIDGVLTNTTTGEDMTGGGTATGLLGENYVYGVSDDPTTGTAVDTTGMSEDEATVAEIKDDLLRDIPPNDLAYFGSFFGNSVIPYFGGAIAGKMLEASIEGRRAIVDEQISALETGATPLFNDAGEYIGFDTSTMTGNVSAILDEYGAEGLLPGGLPEDVANEENTRFNTVFDVQSTAADADPTGMSTEDGFITTGSGYGALDGTEYYIEGDGSVQEVTDGIVNYDDAKSGETVESVYGIEAATDTTDEDPLVSKIYNRFFRSGNTAGLPIYMAKWMDGVDFDERLEKVMVEGKVMYKNAEGDLISAKDLETALKYDNDGNIIETED